MIIASFGSTLANIWGTAWPILVAILLFGIIIFVHELGHFICAKLSGVKVNEFSIGMGPAIFKLGKGETKYCLRILPIGGYVSMEGEDEESDDSRSFGKAKIWKRMIIVAAGAIMNLLLGLVFISLYLGISGNTSEPVVAKFDDDATSSNYGLQVGDRITAVNGMRIYTTMDLSVAMSRDSDGVVDLVVERDGGGVSLEGVVMQTAEIEGRTVIVQDFYVTRIPATFGNLVAQSVKFTVSLARSIWISLADIISGHYSLSDMSGPIGIVSTVAETASTMWQDITPVLFIMTFITVNVGVMNLLPFPALDGARLLILIIEAIRRKPIKPKNEAAIHTVGLVILLAFMFIVSVSDVSKFFRG